MKQRRAARAAGPPTRGSRPYRLDWRRLLAVLAMVSAGLTIGGASLAGFRSWSGRGAPGTPRAAIVDQLAITDPNPAFVASATQQLEDAGYLVDYYPAEAVTVDFYRDLPGRGYAFIVLRSHSTDAVGSTDHDTGAINGPSVVTIGLFTNEVYSADAHVEDQKAHRLWIDSYPHRGIAERYFGITPPFVAWSTHGRFQHTTVVLMGCAGLMTDDLARAFVSKGATAFMSWDRSVTAEHTDEATQKLLGHLLGDRLAAKDAVAETMAEVGPDPSFGARLLAYP